MHAMTSLVAAGGNTSNLKGGWDKLWASLGSFGSLTTFLSIFGVVIVIAAIVKYVFDKRRGGGNPSGLLWGLVAGGLLAAPGLVIPALLVIADALINAGGKLLNQK